MAADEMLQRIERFHFPKGPVFAQRRNRGYSLLHANTGAPIARLIASNSYTGRPGKKRGRRRGLLGVPCCRSTTHSASSQKKEFSGHAGEFNQGQNAQSRAKSPSGIFLS